MKVKVLASGSKGNSTLIRTNQIKLLIDDGVTYQYLCNELEEVDLKPTDIDAILITHIHKDHIGGLASLVRKNNKIKVYILEEMLEDMKGKIPSENINYYTNPLNLKDLKISLIRISHDVDGVGFIIENNDRSLVYITDTGYINRKYLPLMKNKNLYVMESNHDEVMVMEGPYPDVLKRRVLSDHGHLSNNTTASYLLETVGDNTKKIILAHISENNNTEELALATTKELLEENNIVMDIEVAKQYDSLDEIEV